MPARSAKVDPTGVGDAFRAGFLAGLAWGLADARCAQVGSLLATYVVETVGTQEYELGRALPRPLRRGLRRRGGRRGRGAPHLPAPLRPRPADAAVEPVEPPPPWTGSTLEARPARTWSASGPTWSPAPCWRPTARGLFPMGSARGGPDRLVVARPARGAAAGRAAVSRSLRRVLPHASRRRVDTAFDEVVGGVRRPRPARALDHRRDRAAYGELHRLGWAHSVETWRDGELVGGLYGVAVGGLFAGESMFHHATDASKVALVGARRDRLRRRTTPDGCSTCSGRPRTWRAWASARCRARTTAGVSRRPCPGPCPSPGAVSAARSPSGSGADRRRFADHR